jgi:hypothetical protein
MKIKIIIFLISINSSFAQLKKIIIKDKSSNQPISLVAISTQKGNGIYSDEFGRFEISISSKDTLFISHLSYQKITLTKKELDNLPNAIILLNPRVTELEESVVKPSKLVKNIFGYYKEKTFSRKVGPGGYRDFEIFINQLKNVSGEQGYVDKLFFDLYVDIFEKSNSKVRIRVFSVGADGLPKDDILNKEIIKNIDRLSPNLKIDISELNIIFPPEGIFIGLEFFCKTVHKDLNDKGRYKIKTDCPHVPTARVTNFEQIGNSYVFDKLINGKMQWVCWSNGKHWAGMRGHVFKFGAEVSQ